jgi:hypothetical protein
MQRRVLEWAPFRLKAGVEEASLLAASQELQRGFLAGQPGFMRRELLRAPDGSYVDLVLWETREAADAAMSHAADSTTCSLYFRLMTPEAADAGAGVLHFDEVARYARGPE